MIKSAAEFRRLRLSTRPEEYRRAAWDEAPLAVWIEVIERHPDLRSWVAQNKTVPQVILTILADDADPDVRHMVASKNKLDAALQMKLCRDPDRTVRRSLVGNRKVSIEPLLQLAQDEDVEIREFARRKIAGRVS